MGGLEASVNHSNQLSIQVPCSTDSLNTGDVFILDAGLKLYLWSGAEANMYEKSKGVQTMQRIKVKKVSPGCPRVAADHLVSDTTAITKY